MALRAVEGVSPAEVRVGDQVNFEVRRQGEGGVFVRTRPQARRAATDNNTDILIKSNKNIANSNSFAI